MSTSARKARKREGILKYVHPTKVGTPLAARAIPTVTKGGRLGNMQGPSNRATMRIARALAVINGNPSSPAPADPSQDDDAKPTKPKRATK